MTIWLLMFSWERTYVLTFDVFIFLSDQVRSKGTCLTNYQGLFTCITFSTLLTSRNVHLNGKQLVDVVIIQLDSSLWLPSKEKICHECLYFFIFARTAT